MKIFKISIVVILSLLIGVAIATPKKAAGHTSAQVLSFSKDTRETIYIPNHEPLYTTIGEIEFVKSKRILPIIYGTDDETLKTNMVGLHELSENLDKDNNNIILAAHNQKGLFDILPTLKINDQIIIHSLTKNHHFKVIKIESVDKDKTMNFITPKDYRTATLITCVEANEKRLIVHLKQF